MKSAEDRRVSNTYTAVGEEGTDNAVPTEVQMM